MDTQSRNIFALLIVAQTIHSIEEYLYGFADVFEPVQILSELIGISPEAFFVFFNIPFVMFGCWCYIARVRPAHPSALGFTWFWIALELANGIGHISISVYQRIYFPGLATAILLFGLALYLGAKLIFKANRI